MLSLLHKSAKKKKNPDTALYNFTLDKSLFIPSISQKPVYTVILNRGKQPRYLYKIVEETIIAMNFLANFRLSEDCFRKLHYSVGIYSQLNLGID